MTYPASPRTRRTMEALTLTRDVDPATELERDRETPERGETPGRLGPGALDIPDLQDPWAAVSGAMADQLEAATARIVAELTAQLHPQPLMRFASATADANGLAVVTVEYVPVSAVWEVGEVHLAQNDAAAVDAALYLDTGGDGGYRAIDAASVSTTVGATFSWPSFWLGEGHRLEARASGMTAGTVLELGLFGRIHSMP